MWLDRYSAVCQECPDLVAIYESPDGRLALLLRQTLVPLPEEFSSLRRATRSAARVVTGKLRAAGFHGGFMVLQWQPIGTAAAVMKDWPCRYDADAVRRNPARGRRRAVRGRRALPHEPGAVAPADRHCGPSAVPPPFASSTELHALQAWYDAMAPSWLGIEPLLRRALVLKTHRWIAEHILIPAADGRTSPFEIRETIKHLGSTLIEMVPPDDRSVWNVWVGLVVSDLERALRRPSRRLESGLGALVAPDRLQRSNPARASDSDVAGEAHVAGRRRSVPRLIGNTRGRRPHD